MPVKSFSKVGHRPRAQMDRAISMIFAVRPTVMKSNPSSHLQKARIFLSWADALNQIPTFYALVDSSSIMADLP